MAYDIQLAQLNTNIGGLHQSSTYFGFPGNNTPTGVNFHTLLMSYWMCGPSGTSVFGGQSGLWPGFTSASFFNFDPGVAADIQLINYQGSSPFYHGTWVLPSPGMRMHFIMSVDTHAQTVQVFVNDQPVAVAGTWTGTPPFDFNLGQAAGNIWDWNTSDLFSGTKPALGDVWITNPPAFVDLSVTANRRKFINADLTPVDLGNTGTGPFGTSPNIYMSVRPGGVATDILINRGSGGGVWLYDQNPPTIQAPGACTLPIAPPATGTPKLWLLRQPELHFIGVT